MVTELNSYIKEKMESITIDQQVNKKPKSRKEMFMKTAVSTGNGFADAILIAAIIATEMSIGLIYLFLHL